MAMFDNILGRKPLAQGAVISVDPLYQKIRFCTMNGEQSNLLTNSFSYQPRKFDEEFYNQVASCIKQQQADDPTMDLQRASVVLPDQLFLLDMISIPVIHRKAMQQSLSLAIEAIYKNAQDLSLMTYPVMQNKQTATFGLSGVRRDLLDGVKKVFAENGIAVSGVTYASNATVNGAFALNPKLKGESFLLLDIKEYCTRFAFVIRGCTMGYFDLPFGYRVLHRTRLTAEDTLFDHSAGELLVLNAKERAKAKQLTMGVTAEKWNDDGDEQDEPEGDSTIRRNGKRLPKFMQRPTPQSREEYIYENFRIFVKWALELIAGNDNIVSLAKVEKVYVNMPARFDFLFDMVNEEQESNGVSFAPLLTEESDLAGELELYGGFFLGQYNEANTF